MKQSSPRNPYLTTVSGKQIDLVAPRVEDVDFADIAHHLAHNCRFAGACRRTYTVAEHLLRGLRYCTPAALPYWLAHDAHEAYSQDDATPKKLARPLVLEAYLRGGFFPLADIAKFQEAIEIADGEFEALHMSAVHRAAGLDWPVPHEIQAQVKRIDRSMLVTEWRDLMPGSPPPGYEDAEPFAESFKRTLHPFGFEDRREDLYITFVKMFPALRSLRESPLPTTGSGVG